LGAEQWDWLKKILATSSTTTPTSPPANITLLISSIQVNTGNAMVESWLHFPKSKMKLQKVLYKYLPNNLYILSGDVHYGEIISTPINETYSEPIEMTSSGLTHSCTDPFWGGLCKYIHYLFGSYRTRIQKNYGTLNINWKTKNIHAQLNNAVSGHIMDEFNHTMNGDHRRKSKKMSSLLTFRKTTPIESLFYFLLVLVGSLCLCSVFDQIFF
jgi:hypothetical protein